MQFLTLAALFSATVLASNPALLERGKNSPFCKSVDNCVNSHEGFFDLYEEEVSFFCASFNHAKTVTIPTSTLSVQDCSLIIPNSVISSFDNNGVAKPTNFPRDAAANPWEPAIHEREAAAAVITAKAQLHPDQKPKCFQSLKGSQLSKACSCVVETYTVGRHTVCYDGY